MQKVFSSNGQWRHAVFMLTLSVFIFRALMPLGFMPDFSGNTGASLVICSGWGQKTIAPDSDHAPAKPAHDICVFSVNAAGIEPSLITPQIFPFDAAATSYEQPVFFTAVSFGNHPARAPPVFL